jgi:CheY-like chemotaxis protein
MTREPGTQPTILIVEDEALVCEVTAMEFEDAGFRVLTTANGAEALALITADPDIAVLFTDISLRDSIDGWTIAAEARTIRPDLGVVYATGYSPDPVRLVDGALFFRKPYLPVAVVQAVEGLLPGGTAT